LARSLSLRACISFDVLDLFFRFDISLLYHNDALRQDLDLCYRSGWRHQNKHIPNIIRGGVQVLRMNMQQRCHGFNYVGVSIIARFTFAME
jgi:hypothetical protein